MILEIDTKDLEEKTSYSHDKICDQSCLWNI